MSQRSRHAQQSGQALVAVLVTMALVFALAGGIVTVSSALLTQERSAQSPLDAELQTASVLNGALAQVADRGNSGGGGVQLPCGVPTTLARAVPSVAGAACMRVDSVSAAPGDRGRFSLAPAKGGCSSTGLPNAALSSGGSAAHLRVWVAARGVSDAFVNSDKDDCKDPSGTTCSELSEGIVSGVYMAAFDCDLATWSSGRTPYVHALTFASAPLYAWWARYAALDNTYRTGSVYALAVMTGLGSPDILHAPVLVVSDADPSRPPHADSPVLLWKASLP